MSDPPTDQAPTCLRAGVSWRTKAEAERAYYRLSSHYNGEPVRWPDAGDGPAAVAEGEGGESNGV